MENNNESKYETKESPEKSDIEINDANNNENPQKRKEFSDEDYYVKKNKRTDWIAKIVCVVFAFIIWLYVANVTTDSSSQIYSVKLEVKGAETLFANTGFSLVNAEDKYVEVTVSGSKSDISSFDPSVLSVYVDVSSAINPGNNRFDIKIEGLPGKFSAELSTPYVEFFTDNIISKNIAISVKPTYSIKPEYDISFKMNKESVTVTGPESIVNKIARAIVKLDLGSVSESSTELSNIMLVDSDDKIISNPNISTDVFMISVSVNVSMTKTVPLVPAHEYMLGVTVSLEPENVTIKGEPKYIEPISKIEVPVSLSGVTSSINISQGLVLPQNVETAGEDVSILIKIIFEAVG